METFDVKESLTTLIFEMLQSSNFQTLQCNTLVRHNTVEHCFNHVIASHNYLARNNIHQLAKHNKSTM